MSIMFTTVKMNEINFTCNEWLFPFTGPTFLSCESCHDQAKCLESPVKTERNDTFFSQSASCVCKEGFVGDGLTCYDVKLCSDSSCCHQGYRWSPEKGCVDIDECSLPEAPCTHGSQVCVNTPGSFESLPPGPKDLLFSSPVATWFVHQIRTVSTLAVQIPVITTRSWEMPGEQQITAMVICVVTKVSSGKGGIACSWGNAVPRCQRHVLRKTCVEHMLLYG